MPDLYASDPVFGEHDLRLRAVEDHLAILNLLAGSALSADVASQDYWQSIYADDALMDASADRPPLPRDALLAVVGGPDQHAASRHGMAHLSALPHVMINGDEAVATGYLLVVVPDASAAPVALPGKGVVGGLSIYHMTVNRWELVRLPQGWKIARRTIRPMAGDQAREMVIAGLEAADLPWAEAGASATDRALQQ